MPLSSLLQILSWYKCRIVENSIKWNGVPFREGTSSFKIVFAYHLKGVYVYSKRKEFAPIGSRFFPFRIDISLKAAWYGGKETGSHKSCLLCKWWTIYQVVPLNRISTLPCTSLAYTSDPFRSRPMLVCVMVKACCTHKKREEGTCYRC